MDADGNVVFKKNWVAGTVGTEIKALILDADGAPFRAVGDAAVTSVNVGDIYAANLTNADAFTGRSTMTVDIDGGTVAAAAGLVKVKKVVDEDERVLEVILLNHTYRDNG